MTWAMRLLISITEKSAAQDQKRRIHVAECVVHYVGVGAGFVVTAVGTGAVTSTTYVATMVV